MVDKLSIQNEMAMLDGKVRDFYDNLTEDELKKFSTYLMVRWGSSVAGQAELQEYYLLATNQRLNKNFFDLAKHPKLQWLLATTISPGMGSQYHAWIAPKKKASTGNKLRKFLETEFPTLKSDDIDVLLATNTDAEIKQYAVSLGLTPEYIKKNL